MGTIGSSLITLGADQLALFENIFAVDKDINCLIPLHNSGITCRTGDITDPMFLNSFLSDIPGPSLFVNLCSGTNNIRIRNNLLSYDTAYLDSCASMTQDPKEYRFSRLMPYTYTKMTTRYPHWLCWGINPGLVEIITRSLLSVLPDRPNSYDVTIYEFDRLENRFNKDKVAVGWCPEALVEEVMLSPTVEIIEGKTKENSGCGARDCLVNWGDALIPAKIVGHEDIWNLGDIPAVKNGRFYYSLSPAVMNILNMDDSKEARSMLFIPDRGDNIKGLEQVAVQVNGENMPIPKTLVWTEDHGTTCKQYGVNAVQYQTAKSLLLAIMLMQRTDYGLMPLTFNASNLPISDNDWPIFDCFMQELDISWRDGSELNLHAIET
ncbi:hypothetical protein ACFLZ5_03285 [Thermodesulfobacteriota bacterium]